MQPQHKRKIVFTGMDLVGASMKNSYYCYNSIRDDLEPLLIESGYFEGAPFLWVGIIFNYGLKNEKKPHYGRISKRYGDLPIDLELDMRVLLTTDSFSVELLKEFLLIATLDILIHAGRKYKLNREALEKLRASLGDIPEWDYDMEDQPQLIRIKYEDSKRSLS